MTTPKYSYYYYIHDYICNCMCLLDLVVELDLLWTSNCKHGHNHKVGTCDFHDYGHVQHTTTNMVGHTMTYMTCGVFS
jgi:hypothetical protein